MKKAGLFILAVLCIPFYSSADKNPHNVIFMIGDGMGIAQIYAGMVTKGEKLNIERCKFTGLSKTYSNDRFSTDAGAGNTALACGIKTKTGMLGLASDSIPAHSILYTAKSKGLATGIVASCALTYSNTAPYFAHQTDKTRDSQIAVDFLNSDIDVMIGGGRTHFRQNTDSAQLINQLTQKGYQIAFDLQAQKKVTQGKLLSLLYNDQTPPLPERGNMLTESTEQAIKLLKSSKKGFVLIIESAQIDWACHDNNLDQMIAEVLDFDKAIGCALDFAAQDKNTLVVVTGDHETGGLVLNDGKWGTNQFKASFQSKLHTGVPVPVYSFGPGADNFSGFMENSAFKAKFEKLLKIK